MFYLLLFNNFFEQVIIKKRKMLQHLPAPILR